MPAWRGQTKLFRDWPNRNLAKVDLEHSVVVGGRFRYRLNHIPMLDDLVVLDAEKVHNGITKLAGVRTQ